MREEVEDTFERFVEQKWRGSSHVAAAGPFSWETAGAKMDNHNQPRRRQQGPKRK
jgi:hypothetical protein